MKEPGECQGDKSTTCGQKRVGDNREAQRGQQFKPEWTVMGVDREGEERMMSRAAPQR